MTVTLKPATPEDVPYIRQVIVDTVAEQLGAAHWPEPARSHLLGVQYASRRQTIAATFPGAVDYIPLLDGEPAGWYTIAEYDQEIRPIEMMIVPEHRSKGICSAILQGCIERSRDTGRPVRFSVSVSNPRARILYERLGFRRAGGDEAFDFMEYSVPAPARLS